MIASHAHRNFCKTKGEECSTLHRPKACGDQGQSCKLFSEPPPPSVASIPATNVIIIPHKLIWLLTFSSVFRIIVDIVAVIFQYFVWRCFCNKTAFVKISSLLSCQQKSAHISRTLRVGKVFDFYRNYRNDEMLWIWK